MWLWQAEGPQMGTGTDETFTPGHCLQHSPLTKQQWRRLLWLTTINLCLIQVETLALMGGCALWRHSVSKLAHRLGDNTNQTPHKCSPIRSPSLTRARSYFLHAWLIVAGLFFFKCQAAVSLTRKRRWQLSRSVSLWWTSTVAGHWLGRSSTCPPDTNQRARGGNGAECSFIDVPLPKCANHLRSERSRQRSRRCRGATGNLRWTSQYPRWRAGFWKG